MISVCSFVYNEADKIESCLSSLLGHVDEFIIFDLESTDGTGDIVKKVVGNVFTVPYLLCGDSYKHQILEKAKGDWVLWVYADEIFSETAAKMLRDFTAMDKINLVTFVRKEIYNGEPAYRDIGGKRIYFGEPGLINRCRRLIKRDSKTFQVGMPHSEVHGELTIFNAPPEACMVQSKSTEDQNFDNLRIDITYRYLISKYGETLLEPYLTIINSYKDYVHKYEMETLNGTRKIRLAEEFWWNWRGYVYLDDMTLEDFKDLTGITYKEFVEGKNKDLIRKVVTNNVESRPLSKDWGKINK